MIETAPHSAPTAKAKAGTALRTKAAADHNAAAKVKTFMEGKAFAALMLREAVARGANSTANVHASYRPNHAPQQDNFTRPFIERLAYEPDLLTGFTAALSSMLSEGLPRDTDIADETAKLSYDACTVCHKHSDAAPFNGYTAPALDDQIEDFGLGDFVTQQPTAPTEPTSAAAMAEEGPKLAACTLPAAVHNSLSHRLDCAEAVLQALVHVFGGDANTDEPSTVPGLHGTLQHAKLLLDELHIEMLNLKHTLPDDLMWRTFEASELIDLVEHLEYNGGFKFDRWQDSWMAQYLDAARSCVARAIASIETVEVGDD